MYQNQLEHSKLEKLYLDLVSLWGAMLATILAGIQIRNAIRDKAKIVVDADLTFSSVSETKEEYGTRMRIKENGDDRGLQEVYVKIVISNHGYKPRQIVSIFVEGKDREPHQVKARELPAVIEPGCQIVTAIQKEWIDDVETISIGAFDALGKRYPLKRSIFLGVAEKSRKLPSNRKQYRKKDDPTALPVWAWQIRDESSIATGYRKEKSHLFSLRKKASNRA